MDTSAANEIYQAITRLEGTVASLHWFLAAGFTALTAATASIAYLAYDLNKFVHTARPHLPQ